MARSYILSIDVDAPADVTWSVVGDLAGVPRWFPKYIECTVDGDMRTLRNADGGELIERIVSRNDEDRTYRYTVIAGPPLARHEAGFRVVVRGDASTIVWDTDAEFLDSTIDTEERLAGAQRDGLERLKSLCEQIAADGSPS